MPYSSLFPAFQPRNVSQLRQQLLHSRCGDTESESGCHVTMGGTALHLYRLLCFTFHSHTVIITSRFADEEMCVSLMCGLSQLEILNLVSTTPMFQRGS